MVGSVMGVFIWKRRPPGVTGVPGVRRDDGPGGSGVLTLFDRPACNTDNCNIADQ